MLIILLVLACYLWTRVSLGPVFVKRWWVYLLGSLAVGALVVFGVLSAWPTTALASSCQSNPDAFAAALPGSFVLARTFAGALYGMLLFILLSLLLTQTVGRIAGLRNGFFHNRGCPWPRVLP